MTPTLGGSIDQTFLATYDSTVQAALNSGSNVYVIIDLVCNLVDNGCTLQVLTNPSSTTTLAGTEELLLRAVLLMLNSRASGRSSLRSTGATSVSFSVSVRDYNYSTESYIHSGIMNEPHDLPSISTWVNSVQGAVNAIRAAGATNYLLLPGSSYSSAQTFPTEAGPLLVKVTDPLGGTSKLVFDGMWSAFPQREL